VCVCAGFDRDGFDAWGAHRCWLTKVAGRRLWGFVAAVKPTATVTTDMAHATGGALAAELPVMCAVCALHRDSIVSL
jgi:hypothetical protein